MRVCAWIYKSEYFFAHAIFSFCAQVHFQNEFYTVLDMRQSFAWEMSCICNTRRYAALLKTCITKRDLSLDKAHTHKHSQSEQHEGQRSHPNSKTTAASWSISYCRSNTENKSNWNETPRKHMYSRKKETSTSELELLYMKSSWNLEKLTQTQHIKQSVIFSDSNLTQGPRILTLFAMCKHNTHRVMRRRASVQLYTSTTNAKLQKTMYLTSTMTLQIAVYIQAGCILFDWEDF